MPAKQNAAAKKRGGKVEGEGSYTATRNFDRAQEGFVTRNKSKIGKLGKDAKAALDGKEGKSLREAERKGRSKARH
ncbi:MAG: hypothetical protein JO261_08520 [Alphaproteobacteria bacterium]|nr:hypothetical protein [Alphaproteobacteria bacterium]MBV9693731.1 hypothetical protein [Alphaproteobacteria bacterium]